MSFIKSIGVWFWLKKKKMQDEEEPLIPLQQRDQNKGTRTVYKNIDEVIEQFDGNGRYQICLAILVLFAVLFNGYHTLLVYFVANDPGWQCTNITNQSTFCQHNQGKIFHSSQSDYKRVCTLKRSEWKFAKPKTYSIVTEFDLICSKAYLSTLSNSLFFACGAIGSIVAGFVGDKYGRKYPSCVIIFVLAITGLVSGFVQNVWVFIILRGLIGALFYSLNNLAFILFVEIIVPRYRGIASIAFLISSSVSIVLLSIIASEVQEWRKLVLYTSLPTFTVAFASLFVYRSPRWLLPRSPAKAKQILMKIAAFNKISLGKFDIEQHEDIRDDPKHQYSYKDMFTLSPKAFLIILAQFLLWSLGHLLYFAIGYESALLGGNIYLNLIYVFLADIPGYLILAFINRYFGHRTLVQYSSLLVAVFIFPIIVLPTKLPNKHTYKVVFAMFSKMFSSMVTTSMYAWSFEIYPTVIRAQGITICNIGIGIGSAMTPFLLKYPAMAWTRLPILLICLLALLNIVFTFCLPNTKGKPTREKFHELTDD